MVTYSGKGTEIHGIQGSHVPGEKERFILYERPQARGQIGATAASLHHSHSNARSKPGLQLAPQLMGMPDL